jgi:hypothetical protein
MVETFNLKDEISDRERFQKETDETLAAYERQAERHVDNVKERLLVVSGESSTTQSWIFGVLAAVILSAGSIAGAVVAFERKARAQFDAYRDKVNEEKLEFKRTLEESILKRLEDHPGGKTLEQIKNDVEQQFERLASDLRLRKWKQE